LGHISRAIEKGLAVEGNECIGGLDLWERALGERAMEAIHFALR
jgi:hypothetical protein